MIFCIRSYKRVFFFFFFFLGVAVSKVYQEVTNDFFALDLMRGFIAGLRHF